MRNVVAAILVGACSLFAQAGDLTIQTSMANVRQGPSAGHAIAATIGKGARVTPLRIDEGYLEIGYGDGSKGWLYFPAQGWTAAQVRGEMSAPAVRAVTEVSDKPAVAKAADAQSAAPAESAQMPASTSLGAESAGPDVAWTSIAELGFRGGWVFEGLQSGHQQAFRFFLPRAAAIRGAKLRLGFNPVAGLGEHSVLRVDVNGLPVYSSSLAQGGNTRWVEVPLSRKVLDAGEGGAVDVVVRASLMVSEDRCMDDRATASFLHIDSQSGLALDLGPDGGSVLGAWEMLPKHVTLSLPAKADESAFASALVLMRQLNRDGKTVDVVRLPTLGDIVVAAADEVRAAVADHPGGVAALEAAGEQGNVSVLALPDRRVLAFSRMQAEWPSAITDSGWIPVARGAAHNVQLARAVKGGALPATLDEVSFARLGADMSPRDVVRGAEWRIPLGVDRIPAGRVPARMRLIVTSAPVPEAQPMMLYAYVNDELQDVRRLNGGTEQFTLQFSSAAVRGAFNELRLVVQRDVREGNCQMLATGYPVQIARGSSIVFDAHDKSPVDFGALPRHFAAGYDLLLGSEVLEQPEAALTFLANLLNANQYPLAPERIRFIAAGSAAPAGPFIALADTVPGMADTAVRFDRGQMMVKGHDGAPILDIDRLKGIAVVQLADWGGQRGLWIKPPAMGALSATPALGLTFDAVAFVDERGVALTLSPDQPDVARVDYPEYRNWFDLFGAYRYWLMALGWLVVVALLAQLYVKVRSHKKVG